jgi:hypothetical protein
MNEVLSRRKKKLQLANRFKWGGCSYAISYAIQMSEYFLDHGYNEDMQSKFILHNLKFGNLVKCDIT